MATGCETSVAQGKSVLKTYTVQSMVTDAVWKPTQHSPWLLMLHGNLQSAAHGYRCCVETYRVQLMVADTAWVAYCC